MKNSILITRHGETQESLDLIVQGQSNAKLTEYGKHVSLYLGRYLNDNYQISRIVASDLVRTRQTAEIIASVITPPPIIEFEPLLSEVSSGVFEKKSFTDLNLFRLSDPRGINDARPIGGESLNDMRKRVLKWLLSWHPPLKELILIVTHKGPLSAFLESCVNVFEFAVDSDVLDYNVLVRIENYNNNEFKIREIVKPEHFL